jgi:hypothetical protein
MLSHLCMYVQGMQYLTIGSTSTRSERCSYSLSYYVYMCVRAHPFKGEPFLLRDASHCGCVLVCVCECGCYTRKQCFCIHNSRSRNKAVRDCLCRWQIHILNNLNKPSWIQCFLGKGEDFYHALTSQFNIGDHNIYSIKQ